MQHHLLDVLAGGGRHLLVNYALYVVIRRVAHVFDIYVRKLFVRRVCDVIPRGVLLAAVRQRLILAVKER